MKNRTIVFVTGLIVGFICWNLDPFSGAGGRLYFVQFILSAISIYFGYKKGILLVLVYIFGTYLGIILNGFEWEGTNQLGWAILALFMLWIPLLLPLTVGVIAATIKASRSQTKTGNE